MEFTKLNGYSVKDIKARPLKNISEMKSLNLAVDDIVSTIGYYEPNDGGAGTYLIRTKLESDVIDNGLIHLLDNGLVAELIVENTINIKQFGALGDGVTDDSLFIQNACNMLKNYNVNNLFFPKGNYLCNQKLKFPSGNYYGTNESVIIANTFTDSEHFIMNENTDDSTIFDTLVIENINVKMGKNGGLMNGVLLGLKNTTNTIINNCKFYSDHDNTHNVWGIDLYENNNNCKIQNCKFSLFGIGDILTTSISIREYNNETITYDIFVDNCSIEENGKDEDIWISEWNGALKNIYFNNISLNDNSISESIIMVGVVENFVISNSNFYVENLNGRLFNIGVEDRIEKNMKISNCNFIVNNLTKNSSFINAPVKDLRKSIFVEDCTFTINNKPTNYSLDGIVGSVISTNNKFIGTFSTIMSYVYSSINDDLLLANGTLRYMKYLIDGIKYNSPSNYFITNYQNSTPYNLKIKNSEISCKQLIQDLNPSVPSTYKIENCDITITEWEMIVNTSSSVLDFVVILNNVNVNTTTAKRFVDKSYYKLYITNLKYNNNYWVGIPTNEIDREVCVVGTTFLANNGKSIVRKISEGSTIECWEEL